MNDGSQEALQDIQERPRKSESHGPSSELDYWLTRAEETFRREPTLSPDLRRAVWVEMKAVWCYSSGFFRHIFGTMQFLVGAYIAFALTPRKAGVNPAGKARRSSVGIFRRCRRPGLGLVGLQRVGHKLVRSPGSDCPRTTPPVALVAGNGTNRHGRQVGPLICPIACHWFPSARRRARQRRRTLNTHGRHDG